MLLRRVSVLTALIISFGSCIAIAEVKPQLSGAIAQNNSANTGLVQELKLTSAQMEQIKGIRNKYKEPISQRLKTQRQREQELRNLMTSSAPESQIRAKFQQLQAVRQELNSLRFESQLAMRQVLTPDQRSKVTRLMETQE